MGAATNGRSLEQRVASLFPTRDHYIASPAFDWLFLIGSPLLAVVVVLGASRLMAADRVEYYVLAYMAIGHHVPTFLRAYGDADEYTRNRFQLIVLPLCVIPLVVGMVLVDARLLTLIFVWDQYHFVRQHYGFMRIYDVKAGASSKFDARLDQWLSFSAFIAIIAHSGFYGYMYADSFYALGIVFPDWLVRVFEDGSLAVAGVVGLLFLARLQWRIANGLPIAWLKLVLFATTFGVWYFAYVTLAHGFLSYAISSFFHCLQYDAFAWYYNRKKALSLPPNRSNRVFRFVHESRQLWLFVTLILAYGLLSSLGKTLWLVPVLALNTTTGLLHYYFDSFIWRVRRAEFREHLQ